MSIQVAIIDDQDIIRLGVEQILSSTPAISLKGNFATVEEFCASGDWCRFSVVILDDSLPDVDTTHAVQLIQLTMPEARLLVLGRYLTPTIIRDLLRLNVIGFVSKDEALEENLTLAIRRVNLGKVHFSPEAAAISQEDRHLKSLPPRLQQVLELTVRGFHVQEIAQMLDVTPRAVYAARSRLRETLRVKNDTQLGSEALRRGLIDEPFEGF